ncbi:phospholipase D family protein [Oceanobacillus saliphilus]|uniref:phospholipase D family protein n=1 Tax=Oceanobacillus saliphilus TaxID=2925834 RepID=UPI00201DADBE|nr:phospholipase D family protein [Oceanobacillus saliphilus]
MNKKRRWFHKKRWWILSAFIIVYISVLIYHQQKPLPEGISYTGETHLLTEEEIEFLYDLTYQQNGHEIYEHRIFEEVLEMIGQAEEFLIIDMFMVNEFSDESRDFPKLSSTFSQTIRQQMESHPDLKVVFITDDINRTYHSHEAEHIDHLAEVGAEVVYTDLSRLRDPNLLYSGIWRMFFQWFGQEGNGWIPNPFGETSPDVTARSYLQLLNIKANHRKAIITENHGLVLSANVHDASGYHSNIAVKVAGPILKDMVESERAVAAFSEGNLDAFPTREELDLILSTDRQQEGTIAAQIVTENKIEDALITAIDQAGEGDEIWIGMFYLSDRTVIEAMKMAADRNAQIRIILDPNENAFGSQKIGLPNIPVARELMENSNGNIMIRWYNTNEEQYHSKIAFINSGNESYVTAGSSNFTSRNLDDYNLENNISITAPTDSEFIQDIHAYFQRIWYNDNAEFTLEYETQDDALTPVKYGIYWLQKTLRITTY